MKKLTKLQNDQLSILNDTVKYYSEDVNRRCLNKDGDCVYSGVTANKNTDGCAIGRLESPKRRLKLDNIFGAETGINNYSLFIALTKKNQRLGQTYLTMLQELHDINTYWDEFGLSAKGVYYLTHLKEAIVSGRLKRAAKQT